MQGYSLAKFQSSCRYELLKAGWIEVSTYTNTIQISDIGQERLQIDINYKKKQELWSKASGWLALFRIEYPIIWKLFGRDLWTLKIDFNIWTNR